MSGSHPSSGGSSPLLSHRDLARVDGALEMHTDPVPQPPSSDTPPALFGAGGPMLKQFDQSAASSRIVSQAATPPISVVGIGNKVAKPDYSEAKIVVATVGLPARGKSYLSNKLMRYLKWLEYDVKVFNVGQLRRSRARQRAITSGQRENHNADYFSHQNEEATRLRDKLAEDSLEMLIQWLKDGGNVGIHDATNSTRSRRAKIERRVAREKGIVVIFLESICDDPAVIAANVALKVSSGDPDYKDMSPEEAKADFLRRIKAYESVYETITEPHLSYLRIINVGDQVVMSHIRGYLQSRIAFYLMNLHLKPRSIFMSRHGESQYNVEGKIGGDSPLSERGQAYACAMPALILDNIGDAPLTVWTSTLQRTIQTAQYLPYNKLTWKSLDELDAGVCDGMTYEEIEQAYPEDFANRDDDKFNYRYRGGESYRDVVVRLEPVIMELERQENILIIGHQAILRCLYAYFHNLPQADLPYIKIPLHTVIKLTPKAYGCDEERYTLPIGAVDTHRPKPRTTHQPSEGPISDTRRVYYVEPSDLAAKIQKAA
ncbi:bifunctional 6-phosphofructo-2-kinase/fructose-2,6-bisphosphate 2-phosphatase [Wolfiporia cocos MD-104 SS10]|uniref:fructose-2,6-bisphosphate 2-phosphatase n=1 Tax=Wolfiporia cocos (strain MD-104) TaxID=742152 RepID=A0A2H3JM09_WOLCO|nr:bifunctional 6-phosphofructo-2-kinase/fructose-2,6-bisphosphate 2-phosphatase [Wolfiporia cocos MD-104 SS10]